MFEPLAASSALAVTFGAGFAVAAWALLRYRVSVLWSPNSGVDGNRIYALQVALTRRHQPERSVSFYLYVASRT